MKGNDPGLLSDTIPEFYSEVLEINEKTNDCSYFSRLVETHLKKIQRKSSACSWFFSLKHILFLRAPKK
jgi:hypothetical protein